MSYMVNGDSVQSMPTRETPAHMINGASVPHIVHDDSDSNLVNGNSVSSVFNGESVTNSDVVSPVVNGASVPHLANGEFSGPMLNSTRSMNASTRISLNGSMGNSRSIPSRQSGRGTGVSRSTAATSIDSAFASRFVDYGQPSPNPLNAPPNSLDLSRRPPTVDPSSTHGTPVPGVAAIKVEALSFCVFDKDPKYSATGYAIFDVTAINQNNLCNENAGIAFNPLSTAQYQADPSLPPPPYYLMNNYPGRLADLTIETSVSGPGIKLVQMGLQHLYSLKVGGRWVTIVHLGLKENSLASRLSTSIRSRENKSSVKGHEKSPSLSLIDQWLDVLKMDGRNKNEAVVVTAVIKYRHAFMPANTFLETRAECSVNMFRGTKQELAPSRQNSTEDLLRNSPIASAILQGLHPGDNRVKLVSIERAPQEAYPRIPPVDALTLIQNFREVFASAPEQNILFDLAGVETFYRQAHKIECEIVANKPTRSLRQRAKTVVNKLSPQKTMKRAGAKPSIRSLPIRHLIPGYPQSTPFDAGVSAVGVSAGNTSAAARAESTI